VIHNARKFSICAQQSVIQKLLSVRFRIVFNNDDLIAIKKIERMIHIHQHKRCDIIVEMIQSIMYKRIAHSTRTKEKKLYIMQYVLHTIYTIYMYMRE